MKVFRKTFISVIAFVCLFIFLPDFEVGSDFTFYKAIDTVYIDSENYIIEMKYGDEISLEDYPEYEVINKGIPTSFKVGYGIRANTRDDAVIAVKNGKLCAVGVGTAEIELTDENSTDCYQVRVSAAPLSVFYLLGQSNMRGTEGNADESVAVPDNQAYSIYAGYNYYVNLTQAEYYVPSALYGDRSVIAQNGTKKALSYHPVDSITEQGKGKPGIDGAFAYQWNKMTGDKVLLINLALGATTIDDWSVGGKQNNVVLDFSEHVTELIYSEINAGHYTLNQYGMLWCQGCTNDTIDAQSYYDGFMNMYNSISSALKYDINSDGIADKEFFCDVVMPRSGHAESVGYRRGIYTDKTRYSFFESFKDLEMRGHRVAQYYLCNTPGNNINLVSNISEQWIYDADGRNKAAEYINRRYQDGVLSYPVQVEQSPDWYTPSRPADFHPDIHNRQRGYNEIGMDAATNAVYTHNRAEKPADVKTRVTFYDWTGYQQVNIIEADNEAGSSTLVVPVVYPVYESKSVTYKLSDGRAMDYHLYDLTVDLSYGDGLSLSSVGAHINKTVVVDNTETTCTHKYTKYVSDNNATCIKENTKTAYCDYGCNVSHTITEQGAYGEHLYPYYTYNKATYAKNASLSSRCDYCGKIDIIEYENTRLRLKAPSGIVSTATDSSVQLTWKQVEGATGYRVFTWDAQKKQWVTTIRTTGKKTTCTIDNLKSGSSYIFAVRAYVNNGTIIWSDSYGKCSASTYSRGATPVRVTGYTESSVALSWNRMNGYTGYRVFRYNFDTSSWTTVIKSTYATSVTVSGLRASDTCVFAVRGYKNVSGTIHWSSQLYKTTAFTRPGVTSKIASTATTSAITLKWYSVSGADGYLVYIRRGGSWESVMATAVNSCTIKNLASGTGHTFAVKAYRNAGGSTVWSSSYKSYTDYTLPTSPVSISAITIGGNTAVSWKKNGNATGYRVYLYDYSVGRWETVIKNTTELRAILRGLEPGGRYLIAVKSYVKAGSEVIWAPSYNKIYYAVN